MLPLCYCSWTPSNPKIAWICLCAAVLYRVGIISKDLKLQLPQVCPSSHGAKSNFPETEFWVYSGSGSSLWMLFLPFGLEHKQESLLWSQAQYKVAEEE